MAYWLTGGLLSLGCASFGHIFLRACREEDYRRAFWLKGLAGLCFLALGLLLVPRCGEARYARLVVGGLALGLLGDELLALRFVWPDKHDRMFLLGALSFALGHGLYLLALLGRDSGAALRCWPFLLLYLAASAAYARLRRVDAGRFQAAGMLYIALVVFLAAVACAGAVRSFRVSWLLFAAGGVCFAVSDNLLCAHCYGTADSFAVNRAVHISYYAAQLLIAWSLVF